MKYVLAVLGVIVVFIVALVMLFSRGGDDSVQPRQDVMVEYAQLPGELVYSMRGKIVGEEDFRVIRITITREERIIEVLQGYQNNIETQQYYDNNEAAYSTLMLALDKSGFDRQKQTTIEDERGACPLGKQYRYELFDGSEPVVDLWDSSCRKQGNFDGNSSQVRKLFQNQIPDYRDITRGVKL